MFEVEIGELEANIIGERAGREAAKKRAHRSFRVIPCLDIDETLREQVGGVIEVFFVRGSFRQGHEDGDCLTLTAEASKGIGLVVQGCWGVGSVVFVSQRVCKRLLGIVPTSGTAVFQAGLVGFDG